MTGNVNAEAVQTHLKVDGYPLFSRSISSGAHRIQRSRSEHPPSLGGNSQRHAISRQRGWGQRSASGELVPLETFEEEDLATLALSESDRSHEGDEQI